MRCKSSVRHYVARICNTGQFCAICFCRFLLKGGRVHVEHCKKRLCRRCINGVCHVCNPGILVAADAVKARVQKKYKPSSALAPSAMSVALVAADKIADKLEIKFKSWGEAY